MKNYRLSLAFGLLAALSTPLATLADNVVVDWGNTFWLQGSGPYENPMVRVGFNPQPEPPGVQWAALDLKPAEFKLMGEVDEDPADGMRILFAICNTTPFSINATGVPDGGHYEFEVLNSAGGKVFDVIFDMSTSSGGDTIDWVGFNPQPEPPGLVGAGVIGFDFEFDSYSTLTLQCQVLNVDSDPIGFRQIPEPATWILLASGGAFLLLLTIRRRRERTGGGI